MVGPIMIESVSFQNDIHMYVLESKGQKSIDLELIIFLFSSRVKLVKKSYGR